MARPLPRLRYRKDFQRLRRRGRSSVAPGMVLQSAPNGLGSVVRVGFTASRKVGNAVKRNRARRRLVALADLMLPQFAVPGRDYVLIARRETGDRPWDELREDLIHVLERVHARGRNRS
ncbi:MAG: ribonuclease P protein component [Rhodospirillales bacterium]|nr:ribonuclease P protein component [Rhodospirillales bacterium]MDE0712713.1 ribonuclease P protein component [Rhodospirillales bacterium]